MRIPAAILVNRAAAQTWLFAEADNAQLLADMRQDLAAVPGPVETPVQLLTLVEAPALDFLTGVSRIQQYIREGDVFQVNLSRRWHGQLRPGAAPADVYRALRRANPAPFGGLARLDPHHSIVSSSPERLVQVQSGQAHTRPIAGTYPRHADPARDAQTRAELVAHPKERAEHVMLVDLERNDLGRVCKPGSVRVDELMAVATYTHVHHIESSVSGVLRDDVSPAAALRALFPGGTITGCPKVRTMQIIRELETSPRYAYTGSMGYVNLDGDMDMNILIRSMMLRDNEITFSAGAGIVADSDPLRELQETRAKARGLLRALGVTD
jgi:anthranilate synthase component 1